MQRLKAEASGTTGLGLELARAVPNFVQPEDAVNFLTERGFHVTARDLIEAAAVEARDEVPVGEGEGGNGLLIRFMVEH
ncbi:hypothetical protein [Ancylobacter lacus]|uniref:hypothetical protein n=1 Tax=Ancylobacter lacus TaxID=2579970 RepID=UPI001BCE616A|nr:hypothetical protein [Ancylobacter lacus]MBS7539804.1 hypothetical protein [Ancylobacter lacus]